jgi:hypothetical protein
MTRQELKPNRKECDMKKSRGLIVLGIVAAFIMVTGFAGQGWCAEHPKADHPQAEQPKVDHPKAEMPKAEHPSVEHPKAEVPKVEHPKAEHPTSEHPK